MKSFDKVFEKTQDRMVSENRSRIDSEHSAIVESIKRTYKIDDFNSLKESDKSYYKDMICEFWNRESGLTEAGVAFLNEEVKFTEKTSDERVKRYIQGNVEAAAAKFFEGFDMNEVKALKESIEKSTGRPVKDFKAICVEAVGKAVGKAFKHYKF